ncbi:MAG TPA: ABC transporter ATP-binding protein, partial [Armatimonadetes bacterium]|nr:ABC transporter ATP-binding protein [Armatimonadota bacterium]
MAVNSKRIVSACAASSPPATSSTPSTGWRLWGYVRPYWGLVLFTLLLMTASGLLQPALIWIAKDLLKPLFHAAQSEGLRELSRVALLILVLTLVKGLCDFGHVFLSNLIGQRVVVRLRQNLFRHLQTLSLSFFEDARTGQLISHVSNDINAVQMILTTGVATLVISPLAIGGLLVVMFRLNWWLTLLALLVAPVIALLINLAGRRMRLIAEYIQQKLADIATVMQEAIAAIRIVQCFATGEREIAR